MRLVGRCLTSGALLCAAPAVAAVGGTAPDLRCITVKDVVIVGGAEAWADKKLCKSPGSSRYDVIEVAQTVYGAASTQVAFEKASDPQLRELKGQIETLRAQVAKAGDEATTARIELLTAQSRFIRRLARKDRGYAQAITQFRNSVADIAATPEGVAALAQYNAGDEVGALAVLDRLRAANDSARQIQSNIASAVEGRRIARLALEARSKGKVTTTAVIARYEDVTRLDSGVFWDWIELDQLYVIAGRLPDAARAVRHASETAQSDRDRMVALNDLGDILVRQGDLAGADTANLESLAIARKLAAVDPGNAEAQRDIEVSLDKVGDVRKLLGDLRGARADAEGIRIALSLRISRIADATAAYAESLTIARKLAAVDPGNAEARRDVLIMLGKIGNLRVEEGDLAGADAAFAESLTIARKLAAADPGNARAQNDVSISLSHIGILREAQGDVAGAATAYAEGLAIFRKLAAADPGNAEAQRNVWLSLYKLTSRPGSGVHWRDVVAQMEAMEANGTFAPSDRLFLSRARTEATLEAATAKPGADSAPRSALSIDCSKQADDRGLHGKERMEFRAACKLGK